jgi:uncharacterized protein YjiS (DUF1127 family)
MSVCDIRSMRESPRGVTLHRRETRKALRELSDEVLGD